MDRSVVITLVKETWAADAYGIRRPTRISQEVFAQVDSVTRSEFFEGGRNGLNPELVFTMLDSDYDGEKIVVYDDVTYSIYRTYLTRTDTIELYAERKAGVNVPEEPDDGESDTD